MEESFKEVSKNSGNSYQKNKLQATCKNYNNYNFDWNFDVSKFTANFDEATLHEKSCILTAFPHEEY